VSRQQDQPIADPRAWAPSDESPNAGSRLEASGIFRFCMCMSQL
jgi:hypothetical protein